jgi:hypothetical protein
VDCAAIGGAMDWGAHDAALDCDCRDVTLAVCRVIVVSRILSRHASASESLRLSGIAADSQEVWEREGILVPAQEEYRSCSGNRFGLYCLYPDQLVSQASYTALIVVFGMLYGSI